MLIPLLLSVTFLQNPPGLRPNDPGDSPTRDNPLSVGPFGDGRGLPPYLRNDPRVSQEPPDEEEWEAIAAFMEANAPHRWSIYRRFEEQARNDGRPIIALNTLRRRMAIRYRMLNVLAQDQPDLYEFVIRQAKVEDQAIETLAVLRSRPDDTASRDRLWQLAEQFVRNTLEERATRIERLRKALAREEAELARDREDISALVERIIRRFEEEASDFGRLERIREWRERGGGRPPGAGGPGQRPGERFDRPPRPPAN
jgi:hypothetical protein